MATKQEETKQVETKESKVDRQDEFLLGILVSDNLDGLNPCGIVRFDRCLDPWVSSLDKEAQSQLTKRGVHEVVHKIEYGGDLVNTPIRFIVEPKTTKVVDE
jgi:hypothetical protein